MKKSIIFWSIFGIVVMLAIIFVVVFFCVLYPLKHKNIILKYASIYKLEPCLVCAVVNTESGFKSNAVSSAGAVGLMQLMPETAQEIAEKLNFENYTPDLLFSPEINIRFGCYYLNYLWNMFNGNLNNVVASYNAGFNKVNEWLKNEEYATNGEIKNPPIEETKNYLKKIKTNLKVYAHRI